MDRPVLFSGAMVRAILAQPRKKKIYAPRGTDPNAPEHLARRLANGIQINERTGCWEWQRAQNGQGYGTLTINGRAAYAHRLAYELGVGSIPAGLDLMHSCDNPPCINPEHLRPGSRSENMKDCSARGRARIPHPRMAGEANGAAKLKAAQVALIRARLAAGERQASIAAAFGISQSQVSNIRRGLAWRAS